MLEYAKAVQESVYEQLRRKSGRILSWEFCARRHEELLPRRLVAPQVNNCCRLLRNASTLTETDLTGFLSRIYKQTAPFTTTDVNLPRVWSSQSLSMIWDFPKDTEHKAGPIEGLKSFYKQHGNAAKF
ncbi:hypothetical protein HAX54_039562 [Datura stramonium]|uniref:Uncharacterized protein n=1 Tax=Datura stramonium TaxID=4076 RepID=A0ABS8RNL9_DATST|nr:hypothetical protein [Datura stramonium]